jgi:hypothetical protein
MSVCSPLAKSQYLTTVNNTYHAFKISIRVIAIALGACAVPPPADTDAVSQPGITMQGITMQGITMQGITMQGVALAGFRFDGASLAGPLDHVHVDRGELVAARGPTALRGADLVGAHLIAQGEDAGASPPVQATVAFRIAAIEAEDPAHDPTASGHTFLYTLEQWVPDTGTWQAACPADPDGRSAAIPMTGTWNAHGDRVESSTLFTFACTTGVIAKCYRWGYRPWLTGYGDLTEIHQTCTRLARADYCGNGVPHTRDGTTINVWDNLPHGGIQHHGLLAPVGMVFEAGWGPDGAVCMSHARWLLDDGLAIAALCPDRLVPPGAGGTVCDSLAEVLDYDRDARLFNESYLNLGW